MKKIPVLALLGALLLAFSMVGLYFFSPTNLLQYAFLPEADTSGGSPSDEGTSSDMSRTGAKGETSDDHAENRDRQTVKQDASATPLGKAQERFAAFLSSSAWSAGEIPMTVEGRKTGITVARGDNARSDVTLVLAGARYGEVFPRAIREGAFLSEAEVAASARSAVLEDELAFLLFGDLSPLGQEITVADNTYTVVGVTAHERSMGSRTPYTVWIPLTADPSLTPELLTVSALTGGSGEAYATLWKSQAREFFGEGSFYHLAHEKVRGSLLPRFLLLFAAFALLKKWFALLRKAGAWALEDARRHMERSYPSRLIGYAVLRILPALVLLAVTLGALYAVALFAARPLSVFPEWVPDNPVALSSITARFWTLVSESASPVQLVTEQLAVIRFWSLLVRLGGITLLIGISWRWLSKALAGRKEQE